MLSEVFIHTVGYDTPTHCLSEALSLGVKRPEPTADRLFQIDSEDFTERNLNCNHHKCSSRGA
jgi:hypothetical protein